MEEGRLQPCWNSVVSEQMIYPSGPQEYADHSIMPIKSLLNIFIGKGLYAD